MKGDILEKDLGSPSEYMAAQKAGNQQVTILTLFMIVHDLSIYGCLRFDHDDNFKYWTNPKHEDTEKTTSRYVDF